MKIAILIDSSCGIKDVSKYKDLHLVPLMITTEDGKQIRDDENLSIEDFYKLNDSQLLKTSQSVPGEMIKKWDELLKEYDQIICLLLSKGLSGQYNTFKMFSQEEEYKGKVFIVDTNGVSILLERQVQWTEKLIKENKTAQEIVEIIEKNASNVSGYIVPKSLDQLVRGGRISKAAASLAKILKITPILKYDGTIDKEGKTRTFKKAIEEVLEKLKCKSSNNIVDISYSLADNETLDFVKQTVVDKGFEIGLFKIIPNVITCHTGRETFAFILKIES